MEILEIGTEGLIIYQFLSITSKTIILSSLWMYSFEEENGVISSAKVRIPFILYIFGSEKIPTEVVK